MNVVYLDKNGFDLIELYKSNKETKLYRFFEPDPGLFVAESPNVLSIALRQGYRVYSVLCTKKMLDSELLKDVGNVPIYVVDKNEAEEYLGYVFAGEMSAIMYRENASVLKEILRDARRLLVLENVENPTNVGAIFRTAAAFGMDAVLLSPGCADPLYRRAIRVSTGNTLLLKWSYCLDSETEWKKRGISILKDNGFTTVGLALRDDNITISDPVLKNAEKLAIIMGNEGHGLYQSTIDSLDHVAKIQMMEGVDSLNVSVAAGIAMYELGNVEQVSVFDTFTLE